MNLSSNIQCAIIYSKETSGHSQIDYIRGPNLSPIACSCTASHFIVLNNRHECYGFGVNKVGQIDKLLPQYVTTFSLINVLPHDSTREIAAGNSFSAFILESGKIVIHGDFPKVTDQVRIMTKYIAPRGLSCRSSFLCFADDQNRIVLFTHDEKLTFNIPNYTVINTYLTYSKILALTSNGTVFSAPFTENATFTQIKFDVPILSIFPYSTGFLYETFQHQLFDNDEALKQTTPISVSFGSVTVNAIKFQDTIIRLDSHGCVQVLNDSKSIDVNFPRFTMSCFSLTPALLILFEGKPSMPISASNQKLHCCANDQLLITNKITKKQNWLLGYNAEQTFFKDKDHYYDAISFVEKSLTSPDYEIQLATDQTRYIYYTSIGNIISTEIDVQKSFAFNLIQNDLVETPTGVISKFVGFSDGRVWLQPSAPRCVYSYLEPHLLRVKSRPGHVLHEMIVDGNLSVVDSTPSFCEQFGHSFGDLLWFPRRGIVQFVGLCFNKFVHLDFSDNSLFTSEIMNLELVRTFNDKLPHTRNVITAEGEQIEIDVCAKNCIFYPGDRVICEYGDATFLGTAVKDGMAYVQSDEMRVAEIGAAPVDISTIRLIRRISMKATRKIVLQGGKEVTLSLSTNDRVNSFIPGDVILNDQNRSRIIGIAGSTIYSQPLGGGEIVEANDAAELIYRADILGGERSDFVEVGSPAFEASLLVPDDIVRINNKKEYVFKGIGRSGPLFVDRKTQESFATSFSPLVMAESFQVIERRAFICANTSE